MKPRRDQVPVLSRLSPGQARQLRRWLTVDGLFYAEAIARLKQRFGIIISDSALSKWYLRHCTPHAAIVPRRLALDYHLTKSGRGVRVRLYQKLPGITFHAFGKHLSPGQSRTLRKGKSAK